VLGFNCLGELGLFCRGAAIMVGSIRLARLTLAVLVWAAGAATLAAAAGAASAPEPTGVGQDRSSDKGAAGQPAASGAGAARSAESARGPGAYFAQPADDPPQPFVPLRPATVEDQRRLEVVRLFSAARSMENRRAWADAVALLQEALKLDPGSIPVARRLSRLYIGALGRPDQALEYGKRVLAVEPGDSDTLLQLVDYYRRNDPAGAEGLLNEVLANPKLEAHAPGRLLAEYELGRLYSGRLHQPNKAADAFAKVLDGLDDRSANRLSPTDQFRILGNDPATAYLNFGLVFLAAKRNELAVRALERGLVYDEDNPQISLMLADTLLQLKRGEQALALVERNINRQTTFVEAYELLAKVLKALNREQEITPRLATAARRDSKNISLQYVLADRYRETGEIEKAEALYKELLSSQPTPQTYRALSNSLFKRKKAADLLKVFSQAWTIPESQDAIKPQLQAAAADDAMAEAMLDAGLAQSSAKPPTLSQSGYEILSLIANNPLPDSPNKIRRLERLLKLERIRSEQNPSALVYHEIADTLRRMSRHAEAATAFEQLIAKYPDVKSVELLVELADLHRRAGHNEAVKAVLRDAMQGRAADGSSSLRLANLLSDVGQVDDATHVLREASRREPNNPVYELILGGILTKYSRNDEAIKIFQDLLKRFGDDERIVKAVYPSISVIYVNQGDYKKGEAELERLLERFPEDAGANNDLGYLYAEQGKNLEKAEIMIRKALQEDKDNRAYLDSLGWVLFKRGKVKEAIEPLKKAVEKTRETAEQEGSAPDATILEHLGDVYFQLNDIRQAGDAWREAAKWAQEAIPHDRRLPEIRKKLDSLEQLGPAPKPQSSPTP
jgi:tetratricopeptide (TPR) repeat protein